MKRGSMADIITAVVFLFVFALLIIIGYLAGSQINDALQSSSIDANAKNLVQEAKNSYVSVFDAVFILVFVGMFLAVLVGAFMIDTNPIVFVFAIIILAFVLFIGAVLSNIFYDITTTADIGPVASEFTFIPWIMNHFLLLIVVLGFLVIIIIFGKGQAYGT